MSTPIPSRQEMLDRAVRGLRAQGFERSVVLRDAYEGYCVYDDHNGKKCAWGHVDPEGTKDQRGTVADLRWKRIGLAGRLSPDDFSFVSELQYVHDVSTTPEKMVSRLRELAANYSLTYPEPKDSEPKDPS